MGGGRAIDNCFGCWPYSFHSYYFQVRYVKYVLCAFSNDKSNSTVIYSNRLLNLEKPFSAPSKKMCALRLFSSCSLRCRVSTVCFTAYRYLAQQLNVPVYLVSQLLSEQGGRLREFRFLGSSPMYGRTQSLLETTTVVYTVLVQAARGPTAMQQYCRVSRPIEQ